MKHQHVRFRVVGLVAAVTLPFGCAPKPAVDRPSEAPFVRFAQFNIALYSRDRDPEEVARRLATPDDPQVKKIAAIIQDVRPDLVLLNEIDHDPTGRVAKLLQQNYLRVAQGDGLQPIVYGYTYSPPVNTGVPSGVDLDNDGRTDGPGDAFGWGHYPGQYGMLLLSRLDGDHRPLRNWRTQRWIDTPGHLMPTDWYGDEAAQTMRLSSKTHAVVVGEIGGRLIGVHMSHPTPPAFDGPEDRNGKRNYDEIGLIVSNIEELTPLPLVVMGDLNADPNDGSSRPGAIAQLLEHPRIQDPESRSVGGVEAAARDGGVNQGHGTDPALDTADWRDTPPGSGNLRVDYVLPTTDWQVIDAGVFWPTAADPRHDWIDASDHRLVWVDLRLADGPDQPSLACPAHQRSRDVPAEARGDDKMPASIAGR
ncbi:MAG: endonuclease/exonuclease/phosphatase family protein [Planctomycetota bacterium]